MCILDRYPPHSFLKVLSMEKRFDKYNMKLIKNIIIFEM